MTAKEHNRLSGVFLLAHGAFQGAMMIFICLIYGVFGSAIFVTAKKQEDQFIGIFFIAAILIVAFVSSIFVVPQIIGGYKLLKEKPNARMWGIVGSIVSCLSFPFGTAAGVYGLWFLFGDIGKNYYTANNSNKDVFENPPPPQNWA
ncbi:MAG: hypothetical protein MUC29_08880 [Pyrinomonadaceae bacterium]|jgi:hypothetical protein|nr:hypothetical protein [Pyrinomonadaceae bacterium]